LITHYANIINNHVSILTIFIHFFHPPTRSCVVSLPSSHAQKEREIEMMRPWQLARLVWLGKKQGRQTKLGQSNLHGRSECE